jgi:hypothetical protein
VLISPLRLSVTAGPIVLRINATEAAVLDRVVAAFTELALAV